MRLLIVDLSYVFWSIALSKPDGGAEAPLELSLGRIHQLADGFDHVAIACDGPGKSFRSSLVEGYKAGRAERAPHLWALLARLKEVCATKYHVFQPPPYDDGLYPEADDVIASLVAWYIDNSEDGDLCRIVSGDGDLAQLVNEGAAVELQRGTKDGWIVLRTAADVTAWVGVGPNKIADFKALAGDNSDNYKTFPGEEKGKPGIGPTGAIALLQRYGSAMAAVKAALEEPPPAELKPAIVATLRRGGEAAAFKGLELASLRHDVVLPFETLLTPIVPPAKVPTADEWEEQRSEFEAIPEGTVLEPPHMVTPHGPIAEALRRAQRDPEAAVQAVAPKAPPSAPVAMAPPVAVAAAAPPPAVAAVAPSAALAIVREAQPIEVARKPLILADPVRSEWAMAMQPRGLDECKKLANSAFNSGLFAKRFDSADAVFMVILIGRELGLSFASSLQSMSVIEGKVEAAYDMIVGRVLASGAAHYFTLVETDDNHATWETKRVGEDVPLRMSFSVQEAERRGLFVVQKDGKRTTYSGKRSQWHSMPDVMCIARAATKLARAKYPDVVRGLYAQGEIREIQEEMAA